MDMTNTLVMVLSNSYMFNNMCKKEMWIIILSIFLSMVSSMINGEVIFNWFGILWFVLIGMIFMFILVLLESLFFNSGEEIWCMFLFNGMVWFFFMILMVVVRVNVVKFFLSFRMLVFLVYFWIMSLIMVYYNK